MFKRKKLTIKIHSTKGEDNTKKFYTKFSTMFKKKVKKEVKKNTFIAHLHRTYPYEFSYR